MLNQSCGCNPLGLSDFKRRCNTCCTTKAFPNSDLVHASSSLHRIISHHLLHCQAKDDLLFFAHRQFAGMPYVVVLLQTQPFALFTLFSENLVAA